MEDPEHDEPEAAEDVEDLELEPGDVEDVKGGTGPRDAASGLPTGQSDRCNSTTPSVRGREFELVHPYPSIRQLGAGRPDGSVHVAGWVQPWRASRTLDALAGADSSRKLPLGHAPERTPGDMNAA